MIFGMTLMAKTGKDSVGRWHANVTYEQRCQKILNKNIYKLTPATNKKAQQDTQIQDTHKYGANIVFTGNNQLEVPLKDSYFQ